MGQRANFIVKEKRKTEIYYSHWLARDIPNVVSQGPEFCEKFFKEQRKENWLMDNAWAEGGILLDKSQCKLLYFGGEFLDYNPAVQRLFTEYLRKQWVNWDVQWCHKGNVDFAEYLNLMEDRILADGCKPYFDEIRDRWNWDSFQEEEEEEEMKEVLTIIDRGIITDYKMCSGYGDGILFCLAIGEELKNDIPIDLKIKKWRNEIEITECLLIDYDHKKIAVCWGGDTDDRHIEAIKRIWPGWKVFRQHEGLVFHFDYTNRDRSLIEMTDRQFEEYCEEHRILTFNQD